MRHRRIPVGAAIVAVAVVATTASAFAVTGTVPTSFGFHPASSERPTLEEPTAPPAPPAPKVAPAPPVTTPAHHDEPAAGPSTPPETHEEPAPPPAPPGPPVTTPVHHEEPAPTTAPTTPPVEHHETPPTTTTPRPTEPPKPPTAPTTPTTPPAPTGDNEHPLTPTMTLNCGAIALTTGGGAVSCAWSIVDDPAFASYRLVKSVNGVGQIVFTTTDRTKHSHGDTTLVLGTTYTFWAQALDAAGHIIATSPPVVIPCCSQPAQK